MDTGFQRNLSFSRVLKKDLKPADHILVRGKIEDLDHSLKPLYSIISEEYYFHHGIYMGDDEVIDFGGETKETAKPRKVDIFTFLESACDGKVYRVDETDEETKHVSEILERALEMVTNPSVWPEYNLFGNNCESFANFLKTGESYTEQGKNAFKEALTTLVSLLAGGAAALSGSTRVS